MAPSAQDSSTGEPHERGDGLPGSGKVGSVARRLVYSLALIPIVPAAAVCGAALYDEYVTGGAWDDAFRCFNFLIAVGFLVGFILVWRAVVIWTLGRKWLTALVGMIPFVQVAYGQPLWDAGCVSNDFLRLGQEQVSVGVWIWCSVWVWWIVEKRAMSEKEKEKRRDSVPGPGSVARAMTPTAIRLAASIGGIPFVVGVFAIAGIAFEDLLSIPEAYVQTYTCAAIVAIAVWIQIWRRVVVWTLRTIVRTALLALVSIGLPIALLAVFPAPSRGVLEAALFMFPVMGWGAFMALTIRGWPTVRTEIAYGDAAPHCQSCGYLLKGLRSTRCPECGDEPTLDELFAASIGEGL